MNIAIFGGTGFLGSYLVEAFIAHGHRPVLLARPKTAQGFSAPSGCRVITGDITGEDAIGQTLEGADACLYNIGILREFPRRGITFESLQYERARRVMEMAAERGIRRFLLTSANGAKPDGTPYQRTKYLAEEFLHGSALDGTVFRPSVIFGDPKGRMEFATQLFQEIIRPPVPMPLFHPGLLPRGAGRFALSPVHAKDVATVYAGALTDPGAIGKTFVLCGPHALTWRAILGTIARATGRNKWTLPVPAPTMKLVAGFLEGFPSFPLTRDQLTMLLEGNTGDSSAVFSAYGIDPVSFDEAGLGYLGGCRTCHEST